MAPRLPRSFGRRKRGIRVAPSRSNWRPREHTDVRHSRNPRRICDRRMVGDEPAPDAERGADGAARSWHGHLRQHAQSSERRRDPLEVAHVASGLHHDGACAASEQRVATIAPLGSRYSVYRWGCLPLRGRAGAAIAPSALKQLRQPRSSRLPRLGRQRRRPCTSTGRTVRPITSTTASVPR